MGLLGLLAVANNLTGNADLLVEVFAWWFFFFFFSKKKYLKLIAILYIANDSKLLFCRTKVPSLGCPAGEMKHHCLELSGLDLR